MMEIKKILLPFDNSVHSINAAHYALSFAKLMKAHVTIINCFEWDASIIEVPSPLVKDIEELSKKRSEDILRTAGEIFNDRGVEYTLNSVYGSPGKVLFEYSKSKEYDLIIMGSHGHSDISGLFLGSVTHRVLDTIYCPVLVVP
jgi:nucleotide-binding universal stress UspA family protein